MLCIACTNIARILGAASVASVIPIGASSRAFVRVARARDAGSGGVVLADAGRTIFDTFFAGSDPKHDPLTFGDYLKTGIRFCILAATTTANSGDFNCSANRTDSFSI